MNFKIEQLENFCKYPDTKVKCIILFGTNEGAIATLCKKCAEAICGDVNDAFRCALLEMEDVSKDAGEIYAEFHAQSLLGGRRVIIVKNADNSIAAFIKNMLPESKSENLLILSSNSLNTKSSLITWAKDRTDVIIVGCYEEREADIYKDTEQMLYKKGLSADIKTIQVLCSRLSPDHKLNQSEIDKLAIYMGEQKNISVDDVKALISDVAGADIEDLCYQVANGEINKACDMFNRLINEGYEAPSIVRQLSYHFSRLLETKAKTVKGQKIDELIRYLRPPLMFYRQNDFKRQLQFWDKDRLLMALNILYDCERDCKTTSIPADIVANNVIMRLAGAARKLRGSA